MRGRVNCLGLVLLLIVLPLGAAQGHHDDDRPHTLLAGSWVCVSQEVYGQAAAGKTRRQGRSGVAAGTAQRGRP